MTKLHTSYRTRLTTFALGCALVGVFGCSTEPAPSAQVTAILMSTDSAMIEVGDTITLRARATAGTRWVDDVSITWTSTQPSVASVSSTGLVTGISAGRTAIYARFGAISRSAQVTVRGRLARIVVDQDSIDVIPGWQAILTAVGVDAAGLRVEVPLVWESSDSSVVYPPSDGRISGGRVGRATLTAKHRTVSTSMTVSVRPRGGVVTLFGATSTGRSNALFDLALDGSTPVRWPIQPSTLPGEPEYAGFDWSETGQLLYRCGNTRVCVVAPSGATEVVTLPSARVFDPSWWPDGRRIVYSDGKAGQIFDPATRSLEAIPLTESPFAIRVAPSGSALSFMSLNGDYDPEVWVKDGNGIRRVDGYCFDSDWSPNGTQLAVGCAGEVYLEHSGSLRSAFRLPMQAQRVRWEPSGKLLAFTDGETLVLSNADGTGQIWLYLTHPELPNLPTWTFAWRRP